MQFSDTTNLQGLLQDIDFRCSTNAARYLTADKVRNIGIEYDKVIEFVTRNDKNVRWGDVNATAPYHFTDYDIVADTATVDITVPFRVDRLELKNSDDVWTNIEMIDINDIPGAVQEFQDQSGTPRYATINGDQLTLIPSPDTSKTGGLRIYDTQVPTLFDAADTTETPSLPRFAHSILSLGASIAYCNVYKQDRVSVLTNEYLALYKRLGDYLATQTNQRSRLTASRPSGK